MLPESIWFILASRPNELPHREPRGTNNCFWGIQNKNPFILLLALGGKKETPSLPPPVSNHNRFRTVTVNPDLFDSVLFVSALFLFEQFLDFLKFLQILSVNLDEASALRTLLGEYLLHLFKSFSVFYGITG